MPSPTCQRRAGKVSLSTKDRVASEPISAASPRRWHTIGCRVFRRRGLFRVKERNGIREKPHVLRVLIWPALLEQRAVQFHSVKVASRVSIHDIAVIHVQSLLFRKRHSGLVTRYTTMMAKL